MTIVVRLLDTGQQIGAFVVKRGEPGDSLSANKQCQEGESALACALQMGRDAELCEFDLYLVLR